MKCKHQILCKSIFYLSNNSYTWNFPFPPFIWILYSPLLEVPPLPVKLPQVEALIITAWDWVSSLLTHKFFLTLPFAQLKASIPRQVMPTNYHSFSLRFMQQQFHTLCDLSNILLVVIEISPFSHPLCCHLSIWRLLPRTHAELNNWTTVGPQHSILFFILMVYLMPSWLLYLSSPVTLPLYFSNTLIWICLRFARTCKTVKS